MFDDFMQTLTGPCSMKRGDSVLLCVSGGIDSMVLLELMQRASKLLSLRIGVIHVDHGIRMAEAADDARFVLQYCKELSIESHLKELGMNPNTPNIEEEARYRRYASILECKKKGNYLFAATGHTLNDQAETILYRIIRGTGIRGLAGIAYATPDGLIRPMLDISRSQVEDFALREGIRHVLDKTNDDLKHNRNLIRHSIVPIMEQINSRAVQAIARLSHIAQNEGEFVEYAARQLEREALLFDWGIIKGFAADLLRKAPDTLTRRLIINSATGMLGDPRGIDEHQVNTILDVLKGKTAGHTIKRKVIVRVDGTLFVFRTAMNGPYYQVPVNHTGSFSIPDISAVVHVSVLMEHGDAFEIRSFVKGDRIGKRRVSEILSGMGVPALMRPFWPVLVSGKDVIAAASCNENYEPSDMVLSKYYGK